MNLIGFSLHYDKMHGQTFGTLLSIDPVNYYDIPKEGLFYDIQYTGKDGEKHYNEDVFLSMDEKELKKLYRLVFIGNKMIPFTTYRTLKNVNTEYYLYDYEGMQFAFKFKGEKLTEDLKKAVDAFKTRIEIYD